MPNEREPALDLTTCDTSDLAATLKVRSKRGRRRRLTWAHGRVLEAKSERA